MKKRYIETGITQGSKCDTGPKDGKSKMFRMEWDDFWLKKHH